MGRDDLELISSKDWDLWFSVVKSKAVAYHIWDLIDPSKNEKPKNLEEPEAPTEPSLITAPLSSSEEIAKAIELYGEATEDYTISYEEYDHQQQYLVKIIDFIYDTVSTSNFAFLQGIEAHPWDLLRALQAKLAPSDQARSLELQRLYKKLVAGPAPKQSLEAWINKYDVMYVRAQCAGIAEVKDGERAYVDLTFAIEKYDPILARMAQWEMSSIKPEDYEEAHLKLIQRSRDHIRLSNIRASADIVFSPAESNDKNEPKGETSFRSSTAKPGRCVCGIEHWYGECWYLRPDHPKKPSNWKGNRTTAQKVQDKLETQPELKAKIDKALARSKKHEARAGMTRHT